MIKQTSVHLLIALVLTGCATARVMPAPSDAGASAPVASDQAACAEIARSEEPSMVFRAALAHGVTGTGLMTVYAAAYGAAWGAIAGGSRADGVWIGAAAGAGIGMVMGVVDGIGRVRDARVRHDAVYERCLAERREASDLTAREGGL